MESTDAENWIEKLQNEEREAREAQEWQKAREQDFADFEAKRADREWRRSPEGQKVAQLMRAAGERGEYLPWHEAQVMARQQLAAEKLEDAKSPQIKDGGTREPAKAPLEPSQSVGHAVVATPAVGAAISDMLERFEARLEAAGHQAGANLRESLDWIRAEIKHDLTHAVDSLLASRPAAGPPNYNFDKMAADVLNGVAQRLGEVVRGKDEEEKGKGKGGQRPYPGPRLEDHLAATIDAMAEKFGRAIVSALRQIAGDLKNDLKTLKPATDLGQDRFHDDGRDGRSR